MIDEAELEKDQLAFTAHGGLELTPMPLVAPVTAQDTMLETMTGSWWEQGYMEESSCFNSFRSDAAARNNPHARPYRRLFYVIRTTSLAVRAIEQLSNR